MTRATATTLAPAALLLGLLAAGCGGTAIVQKAACVDDGNCMAGEGCVAGLCQRAAAAACTDDADCAQASGELCANGTCTAAPASAPDSCSETRDCPVTDFCNTATSQCEALRDGFCRTDAQCLSGAPMCDTPTPAQPGRCVECRADTDCEGGVCGQGGVCVGDGATVTCPPNASLVPGSSTVCQCDAGFTPDLSTSTCVAQQVSDPGTGSPPPDTTSCVPNASPVPGIPGQCRCDAGFEPSADGTSCVLTPGSTTPTPPPPDDGNGGGGSTEDDDCGENAIPVFFLCVCLPGYVVDSSGSGCVLDSGGGGGGGGGTGGDDCPPHSTLEGDGYCYCDQGYAVDWSGTECVADECMELGYYGDGYFCDDYCPEPDPDC